MALCAHDRNQSFTSAPTNYQAADGALVFGTPILGWTAGDFANAHDVYLDTVSPPVAYKGRQTATSYDPNPLSPGTYYWRIDEVDDPNIAVGDPENVWEGDVWSFEIADPGLATDPDPADGATGVDAVPTLSWTAGLNAISRDVWFGKSPDALTLVSDDQAETTFPPGVLIKGETYYWAVDEYDGTSTYEGPVWSFAVAALSGTTNWTNGDPGSNLWNIEANWDNGVPGLGTQAYIKTNGPALIDSSVEAVATGTWARWGIPADPNVITTLEMTGGSLTLNRWALGNGGPAIVNISDGTISTSGLVIMGDSAGADTTLNISGGTVNLGAALRMKDAAESNVYLSGGVLTASSLDFRSSNPNSNTIDLAGGTLILAGDDTGTVNDYVDAGRIIAHGGLGNLIVTYDEIENETTVTASYAPGVDAGSDQEITTLGTSLAGTAWDPDGLSMTYAWTSSDPAATSFGTPTDPNTTVTFTDYGTYELTLTATNSIDLVGSDSVSVTVIDPGDASDPDPADGATGVVVAPTLSWTAGVGATSHDVWFGTTAEAMELVSGGQEELETTYAPGTLIKGQTYYWAVDETDSGAVTHYGAAWSFTVAPLSGTTSWTGADPNTNLWSSEDNWDIGVPGIGNQANIYVNGLALIDSSVEAVATGTWARWGLPVDPNSDPIVLDMTGGSLTLNRWALGNSGPAIVNISGGTISTAGLTIMGDSAGADTTLNISGGTVNLGAALRMKDAAESNVYLSGGVLTASSLDFRSIDPSSNTIDLAGGTLILAGDDTGTVNGYVDSGRIIAYGGAGKVIVTYDEVTDKTTVIACSDADRPDLTGDCAVNEDDLQLVIQDWLYATPAEAQWSFDMATDPVGTGEWDLKVRGDDPGNANYTMGDDTGTGTLEVTGAGTVLLDQQFEGTAGLFDTDVHYVIKSTNEYAVDLWIIMATSSVEGGTSLVGISTMKDPVDSSQTVEIWGGAARQQGGYTPAVVETGFDPNSYLTIDVNYDYDTDTYDWSISDGSETRQRFDVPYPQTGTGTGGAFTLKSGSYGSGAGNAAPGSALIDQLDITIHGSIPIVKPGDVDKDGDVELIDFAKIAEYWMTSDD